MKLREKLSRVVEHGETLRFRGVELFRLTERREWFDHRGNRHTAEHGAVFWRWVGESGDQGSLIPSWHPERFDATALVRVLFRNRRYFLGGSK